MLAKNGEQQLQLLIRNLASPRRCARSLGWGVTGLLAALALVGCSGSSEPENPGTPPRVSLITTDQYRNSLAYVFGSSIELEVDFPPQPRTEGLLANGAAVAGVSASQLAQFQRAAGSVAAQVANEKHRNFLISCQPASAERADDACASEFLAKTGRFLYRRALTDSELAVYVKNAGAAADRLKDFYAGIEIALEGMLINPEVLFIVERSEPDPRNPGRLRLDSYSLASRLSFFLWNAGPDDKLLTAAESGELQTKEGRARAVDRMLASPRLVDGMRAFISDMLAFDDFGTLSKDPLIYPAFTSLTAAAAQEQTLRTAIDHLIIGAKDYRDLYTTRSTFISPELAVLYRMPAPMGWEPYTFPPNSPRVGLLTQVSFLALHSHPGRSSPTLRGAALRELLLCQTVPPPPPNVDFSLVLNPDSQYPTQRQRVEAHLENPSCAGCHKIMDPMGLALENFNGSGRYRETENGAPIDTSGVLDGVEFQDVAGLAQALHDNPALPSCFVQRLFSYGFGGPATPDDNLLLDHFNATFASHGYRVPDLLRTIALSDAFSRIRNDEALDPGGQAPGVDEQQVVAVTQNGELQ